ncbi:MAG: hypothetical protein EXQ55_04320 [Acidobacteria bacterium]|nr:hypothetical protein [Acidobacteriota bacterium]
MRPATRTLLVFLVLGLLALPGPTLLRAGGQQPPKGRPTAATQAVKPDPCASPKNKIIAENCKPGNPEPEWDVNGAGDASIQGFSTEVSVNHGEAMAFKIKTESPKYRIDIYRLGYYGGTGARLVTTIRPSVLLPQAQPECLTEPATKLYDCGNWAVSASWAVPREAMSGLYIARPVREDAEPPMTARHDNSQFPPRERFPAVPHAYGASNKLANEIKEARASHIYFVVRDDEGKSDILFQTSDPAWEAYNRYGGSSTYGSWVQGDAMGQFHRAFKVSFNRPLSNREWRSAVNAPLNDHYSMIRWLELNGYDVSYFAGVDSDRMGAKIKEHKLFLSNGHDEYWSAGQRTNVEAARDTGVSLAFFAGNEVFWKTRYEASIDKSHTAYRTLVCYKETHSRISDSGQLQPGRKLDPVKEVWTGTWRDASDFNPEGPKPENGLMGVIFTVNGHQYSSILVPAQYGKMRFWRNTSVATLKPGEVAVLDGANLGHEWDEDIDNGFRPAGIIHLSETTVNNVPYIQDWGSVYDAGTGTHHLTLYRAKSGALVFGAGTVQWAWGLDGHHDRKFGIPPERENHFDMRIGIDPRAPDPRVQQATVNLFADMGVQPANLQPNLVPAEPSQDKMAPLSKIVSPVGGSLAAGVPVTIAGTAADLGGGNVGGVEVSVDGGATWHPAGGLERWTFEWSPDAGVGQAVIMSRATDDSNNIETPASGVPMRIGQVMTNR